MGAITDGSYKSMWSDLQATIDTVNRFQKEQDANPKRCDGCRYWQSVNRIDGECRRHAPNRAPRGAETGRVWPMTECQDWCGDHGAVPMPVPVAERMPGDPAYDAFDAWVGTPGVRMYLRDAFYAGRASVKP